ncbi:hypothetical protein B0T25DRAFT_501251 [Lasiosphaeria hispida]|uniref:SET domain-containing protein n=1 Tax=Lasiosphaeria hispida TaxID=260671 RepID=A0AAJ0HHT1_9PEZI|nr:hypothetical protein B0T25DRAFT_501251 [Lasiosphaeria hispida]
MAAYKAGEDDYAERPKIDSVDYDASTDDEDDDDYSPPPRQAFHTEPELCSAMLKTIKAAVPLAIESSNISMGSGLFVTQSIDAGREIYRSNPVVACVDAGNPTFCHYCLDNTKNVSQFMKARETSAKACTGCRVARFCSKESSKELRVRSLKNIAAGEELTICYIDPTITLQNRRQLLKHEYFFDCRCIRCKNEEKHISFLLKGNDKISVGAFNQAQDDIRQLVQSARNACEYPSTRPKFEDLASIETKIRTITRGIFSASEGWNDGLEPLPRARLALAGLYMNQGNLSCALRLALQGISMSQWRNGPIWVNDMMDVLCVFILIWGSELDAPIFRNKTFPTREDCCTVATGYLFMVCNESHKAFGGCAKLTESINNVFHGLITKKPGAKPGSTEFADEFNKAQANMLTWASISKERGISIL